MVYGHIFWELFKKGRVIDPEEKPDYSYDIPIEDLKRYRKLPPEEVFRWLEEANDFSRMA